VALKNYGAQDKLIIGKDFLKHVYTTFVPMGPDKGMSFERSKTADKDLIITYGK